MNTIEFLGGVQNGKLGKLDEPGAVGSRFKDGVCLLGGEYTDFGVENMYRLRNGLTHQYLASLEGLALIRVVNNWNTDKAISKEGDELTLNVARLVVDLGVAWGHLRCELLKDDTKRQNAKEALERLPRLL
jgi:hypothetical protein